MYYDRWPRNRWVRKSADKDATYYYINNGKPEDRKDDYL
jgi:hypothetical protein